MTHEVTCRSDSENCVRVANWRGLCLTHDVERMARAIESGTGNPDTFKGTVSETARRDARVAAEALATPAVAPEGQVTEAVERVRQIVRKHPSGEQIVAADMLMADDLRALLAALATVAPADEDAELVDELENAVDYDTRCQMTEMDGETICAATERRLLARQRIAERLAPSKGGAK